MGTTSSFQRIARKKWVGDFPDDDCNYPWNARRCQEQKYHGPHFSFDLAATAG
jgi:hypothetical protein